MTPEGMSILRELIHWETDPYMILWWILCIHQFYTITTNLCDRHYPEHCMYHSRGKEKTWRTTFLLESGRHLFCSHVQNNAGQNIHQKKSSCTHFFWTRFNKYTLYRIFLDIKTTELSLYTCIFLTILTNNTNHSCLLNSLSFHQNAEKSWFKIFITVIAS